MNVLGFDIDGKLWPLKVLSSFHAVALPFWRYPIKGDWATGVVLISELKPIQSYYYGLQKDVNNNKVAQWCYTKKTCLLFR